MTCPACGSDSFSSLHRDVRDYEHGLPITVGFDVCRDCGWLAQVPPPTRESLAAAYPADYRAHVSGRGAAGAAGLLRKLKDFQASLLAVKILPFLPADRNLPVLDLGCGSGHLLFALQSRGYQNLAGLDQNPALVTAFAGTRIRFQSSDLEGSDDLGGPYGAIIMVNVIEHFLQPDRMLLLCRKSLAPGGRIIVITPSADGFSHRVFGKYWSGLHAPRHTQIFNPQNFQRLAARLAFARVQLVALSDPGSWAVSFQNRVRDLAHTRTAPSGGTAWYSLALLPLWFVLSVAERALGRGSSFLAVLD